MALSNAERQRRYRQRRNAAARAASRAGPNLTPEQIADRGAVMAEPIYPVPKDVSQIPTFMGWNRYEWRDAPEALIDHFGMRSAWEGWNREVQDVLDATARMQAEAAAEFDSFLNSLDPEVKERALQIYSGIGGGRAGVYRQYKIDPTFGIKSKRRVT